MANITLHRDTNAPTRESNLFWDPFREMREFLRWDPMREMRWPTAGYEGGQFMPTFEVRETKDAYVFKADVPGVKENDLDISMTADRITITGHREAEKQDQNDTYYSYERSYGTFARTFTLPTGTNVDQTKAELKEGVLTLLVPKKPEVQPRRIAVKATDKPSDRVKA